MNADKQMLEKTLVRLYDNVLGFTHKLAANKNHFKYDASMGVLGERKYKPDSNSRLREHVLAFVDTIYANNYDMLLHGFTMTDEGNAVYDLNIPHIGFDLPEKGCSYDELEKILDSFDKDYSLPFRMYISGYEYREIASSLDLPVGIIKGRIFFVRERFVQILQNRG